MFKIGDTVKIKDLQTLLAENSLTPSNNFGDIYINNATKYVLFPDFPFYGKTCTVTEVDEEDNDGIPYFLSIGIWAPEFMLINMNVEEPKEVDDLKEVAVDHPVPVPADNDNKVYINNFNNKPFGKLFVKLIKLDPKIAEFSNTRFSALKKHELLYIADLISKYMDIEEDYEDMDQEQLAMFCYDKTVLLDV